MDSSATNYNANATQADNSSCTYPTPSCTLTASVSSLQSGSSATLSWTTTHATSASIDNSIGAITPNVSGSSTITPSSNTTYTLTASGAGGTVHCAASVTVVPPPPAPTCTLTASPTSIQTGSASTLKWTTTNASSFSINQNIGSLTPVASGSKSVSPTNTITYTGTATGTGGTVHCAATVTVTTPPPPPVWTNYCTGANDPHPWQIWAYDNSTPPNYKYIGTDPSCAPPPVANGCIDVLKETFDPTGNKLTPVAQFTFTLDGGVTVKNDANGNARFIDVTPGVHKVVETPAGSTWKLLSVTPAEGSVTVQSGSTCSAVVFKNQQVVTAPPPPAPTCTLTASPTSIQTGSASTLKWTTTNASSFSINQNIGSLTPVASGSKSVKPTSTITYTGTATGTGGTVHCAATVTVTTPPPPVANGCIDVLKETFDPTGNKLTPVAQFTFTLDGGVTVKNDANGNARFIDVTPGVHKVVETPAGSTWKLLSVTPAEGSVTVQSGSTCSAVVFKNQQVVTAPPPPVWTNYCTGANDPHPWQIWAYDNSTPRNYKYIGTDPSCAPPPPDAPTCTLSASPTRVNAGDHTTLTWTTTNADTFSIDQGVGSVSPAVGGSVSSRAINGDTTFTGTAIGPTGKTVTCTTAVTINTGGGGGGGPSCTMTTSASSISSGGSATLTWGGSEISNVDINNGIATATTSPGSVTVSPTGVGSYTYTGTFHANNGQTLTCSASLQVTGGSGGGCTGNCGGGGGSPTPTVTLSALPHVGAHPLAYLYLSQIPYTGLDLGPIGTALYWIALIGWSIALAYLMIFGAIPFTSRSVRTFGARVSDALNAQNFAPAVAAPQPRVYATAASAPPSVEETTQPEAPRGYSPYEGFKSFAHNGALSIDDIVKGLSREQAALATHRGSGFAPAAAPVEPVIEPIAPILEDTSFQPYTEPIVSPAKASEPVSIPADVRGLTSALVEGDRAAVFAGLRQLVRGGGAPERLVSSVACLLDDTYRARIDGSQCDAAVARLTARIDTPTLEKLIASLTTAIDSSYSDNVTGAKLAFTRALAVLGA
ncbi:MAG: hypothetical protein ACYCZZ_00175 [Minisyncoccota bacterium]